jgi:hypothetical protein
MKITREMTEELNKELAVRGYPFSTHDCRYIYVSETASDCMMF